MKNIFERASLVAKNNMKHYEEVMKMNKHEKELLRAIADGKQIEESIADGPWAVIDEKCALRNFLATRESISTKMRIKPALMLVNGIDVPEAEREAPEEGTNYWFPSACAETGVDYFTWNGDKLDYQILHRKCVHLSEENALAHAKALGWYE